MTTLILLVATNLAPLPAESELGVPFHGTLDDRPGLIAPDARVSLTSATERLARSRGISFAAFLVESTRPKSLVEVCRATAQGW